MYTSLSAALALGCSEDIAVLDGPDAQAASGSGASGAAGPGGSGSSGGPSTGGGGGQGGSSGGGSCASLSLAGSAVMLDPPNDGEQGSPAATLSSDDASQVSVAFHHLPYLDVYVPEIAYVSFEAWGAWPAGTLGPSESAITDVPSFRVSQTAGDSFNLLLAQGDNSFTGATFLPRVAPPKTPPASVLVDAQATRSVFVSSAGSRHLLGLETTSSAGATGISATLASSNAAGEVDLGPEAFLGCASVGPMPADAVPSGDGWLVAFANGASAPGCLDPELPGPPHAIHVVRIAEDGTFSTGAMLPQGGPIAQIGMAARSDGAWLVWQRASGGMIAPIQAVRIDPEGDVVLGPLELVDSEAEPVSFDVDRLGDDLAIAYEFAGLNAEAPGIVAARAGGDGVVTVSGTLDGPILTSAPSVIGAPSGDQILVAFGVLVDHPEVGVARFDCGPAQ